MSAYRRASRSTPCPVCGGARPRCQIFDDGRVNCRNVSGPDSSLLSDRWTWAGYVNGGPGGSTLLPIEPTAVPISSAAGKSKARKAKPTTSATPAAPTPAVVAVSPLEASLTGAELEAAQAYERRRDASFKAMVASAQSLSETSKAALKDRGMTTAHINELEALGFREIEPGKTYGGAGVGRDQFGKYTGPAGFLIPSFRETADGIQYLGFQVAVHKVENGGGKYVWMSRGAAAEDERALQVVNADGTVDAAPLFAYRPQGVSEIDTVYVTDSSLKAYVTALRLQQGALGAPGMQYTASMNQLRLKLRELVGENAELRICLAADAGDTGNHQMMGALLNASQTIQGWGYRLTWVDLKQEDGKGKAVDIDEVPADPQKFVSTAEFLHKATASARKTAERRAARQWDFGFRPYQEGDQVELPFCHTDPQIYAPGERTATLVDALAQGHRVVADRSGTGAGKSHWWASLTRDDMADLNVDQVLVLSPRHMEQGEEFGVPYVRGRQPHGTKRTADGRILTVQGKDDIDPTRGEKLFKKGNCVRGKELHWLQQRNLSSGLAALCTQCPVRDLCETAAGGYRHDRQDALAYPVVVLHPSAMQEQFLLTAAGDEGGAAGNMPRTGVVLDDVALTSMTETVVVSGDSVRRSLTMLGERTNTTVGEALSGLTNAVVSGVQKDSQAMQGLRDSLNATLQELRSGWAWVLELEEQMAGTSTANDVWVCWLPYLRDWLEGRAVAQITTQGKLSFKRYNTRLVEGLRNAAWVLVLDATASVRVLEALFSRPPLVIAEQNYLTPADLKIKQVMGLGTLGYNRTSQQQFNLTVVLKVLAKMGLLPKSKTAVVDTKEGLELSKHYGAVGLTYLGDSRGSNRAYTAGCTHLLMVGAPNTNLGEAALLYELLFGEVVDTKARRNVLHEVLQEDGTCRMVCAGVGSDHEDFGRFYAMLRNVELIQALGRMRHQRRKGEVLTVIVLGDLAVPFPVDLLSIAEITTDGEHKQGRVSEDDLRRCTITGLKPAAFQVKARQQPITPETLASESGLHPRLLREWFGYFGTPRWGDSGPATSAPAPAATTKRTWPAGRRSQVRASRRSRA